MRLQVPVPQLHWLRSVLTRLSAKTVGRISAWTFAFVLVLLIVTMGQSFGLRRIGCQIGFRDGAFVYERQRVVFRRPPPRGGWRFYASDYYMRRESPALRLHHTRRTTELSLPLYLPLLVLAPLALLGREPRPPAPPGPYRVTVWRYLAGLCEYVAWGGVSALLLTAFVFSVGPYGCEEFPVVFIALVLLVFPYGAYLAAARQVAQANRSFPTGFCLTCCYDLTGNVSGVCPECGTVIAEAGGRGK